MYIAKHFELTTEQIADLLANATTAQVVGGYPEGPEATILPISYVPDAGGGLGSILAHVTRTNPLWKREPIGDLLAIVSGPDAYISPTWFPSYPTAPEVPTWNYLAVHCRVQATLIDGAEDKDALLKALIGDHEPAYAAQWRALGEDFARKMLAGIVAFELRVLDLQCKLKLNQHRKESHAAMHAQYSQGTPDERALAAWMQRLGMAADTREG